MSVLPQLDPDELLPGTNPGQDQNSRQEAPEFGRAPQTDPRQQVLPSGRPITRPDPAQATFRPVQLRKMSGNTQEIPPVAKQFKSVQLQLNGRMGPMTPATPPLEEQAGQQSYTPAPLPTSVEPVTAVQPFVPFQTFDEQQTAIHSDPAGQVPGNPPSFSGIAYGSGQISGNPPSLSGVSNGSSQLPGNPPSFSGISVVRESTQPYDYSARPSSPGFQSPVADAPSSDYWARRSTSITGALAQAPRRISGFLGIDEMPTTRLAAIAVQAKELATVVVQPQQAATIIMQGETKKPGKKNWLSFALRAGVTIALFFFLLKGMNWGDLLFAVEHARKTNLLIGLMAGVLCIFFSAWGWRSAIQAENIDADLSRLIALYLVGLGFSHFLPTSMGGDAVKAYYVGKDSGNMAGAASSALTSRITSFIGMLVIAVPGVAIFYHYVTTPVVLELLLLCVLLLGGIATALLLAAFLPKISRLLPAKLAKHKMLNKVLEVGTAMTKAAMKPRAMVPATLFGMMFWVASFINYYGYASALGIKVALPFYVIAIPFISIVTALPISIGGYGVRENVFVWLFTQIAQPGMHVAQTSALALILLMDAQVLLFGLIGGVIYFTMPKKEKISNAQ